MPPPAATSVPPAKEARSLATRQHSVPHAMQGRCRQIMPEAAPTVPLGGTAKADNPLAPPARVALLQRREGPASALLAQTDKLATAQQPRVSTAPRASTPRMAACVHRVQLAPSLALGLPIVKRAPPGNSQTLAAQTARTALLVNMRHKRGVRNARRAPGVLPQDQDKAAAALAQRGSIPMERAHYRA